MELSGDKRLMTRDEIEELSSFDLGTEMDEAVKKPKMTGDENLDYDWKETPEGWVKVPGSEGAFSRFGEKHKDFIDKGISKMVGGVDERTMLKQKYPGLTDDLLDKILIDNNPQRKAEVLATLDEFLKLREIGKSETEAYDIITKSFKKTPTKHASGGIAGELHLNRPGYRKGLGVGKKKEKKEYRMPPMFMFPNWGESANFPYKSLEDIPPEVLEMLRKDPVFDLDTFLKKVAWSDPDKTRIQTKLKGDDEAWGITSGMTGDMLLNYQKFGKGEKLPASGIVLKHIKDKDKVSTILHEMRHAKMAEPWFAKSSAIPKWVQKYEEEGEPHYLDRDIKDEHKKYRKTQKDVSGEELYIRYLDQLYGDVAEKGDIAGSEYKPYFDKILKEHWKPHAKAYREILEAEKAEMAKPIFRDEFRNRKDYPLKSGGLARILGV
jgi:hypothetical protein